MHGAGAVAKQTEHKACGFRTGPEVPCWSSPAKALPHAHLHAVDVPHPDPHGRAVPAIPLQVRLLPLCPTCWSRLTVAAAVDLQRLCGAKRP